MIWLRRLITVPLGILFFVLSLVTLVLLQINNTFLDPEYYTEELARQDIYEFILIDLMTSVLDEARQIKFDEEGGTFNQNPLVTSGLNTEEIVASINRAIPPKWIQSLTEDSLDEFGKYLVGTQDTFLVKPLAGDQAIIAVDEFKSLMRKSDAYNLLYSAMVIPTIERSLEKDESQIKKYMPLGIQENLTVNRLIESVRRVVPVKWVQTQVENAIDEVTPYIIGETNTFEIRVVLTDRVDIALEETKSILSETNAYELLYTKVIEPELLIQLSPVVDLPFAITVTEKEILLALREVAPLAWVEEQAEIVIDASSSYITGKSDNFSIEISLIDNKDQAQLVLMILADRRLTEVLNEIRKCSASESRAMVSNSIPTRLPNCLPSNIDIHEIKKQFKPDVVAGVEELIMQRIPDSVIFTDLQVRDSLDQAGATDNLKRLDNIRKLLRNGCIYTHENLRRNLAGDQANNNDTCGFSRVLVGLGANGDSMISLLDAVRSFLSDEWTYTETDFREYLAADKTHGIDISTISALDNGRNLLVSVKRFRLFVYIPMLMLLFSIGFLGGRNWPGRVAYAAGCLLITSSIMFVSWEYGYESFAKSGPLYKSVGLSDLNVLQQNALDEIAREGGNFPNTLRLTTNKLFHLLESLIDQFASGIARSSLKLTIIGIVIMLSAIFSTQITNLVKHYKRRLDG